MILKEKRDLINRTDLCPTESHQLISVSAIPDSLKLMRESSLLGFRMSIFQLKDSSDDQSMKHAIQLMLSTTHNISPVGVLFNFDCSRSVDFMSAVSNKAKSLNAKIFEKLKMILFQCAGVRCFAASFNWLIFEENSNAYAIEQLRVAALYIDAQIAYINFADAIESANER